MEAELLISIEGERYARHFNDSLCWPQSDCGQEAERAFRDAFLTGAREVVEWDFPDVDAIEAAR